MILTDCVDEIMEDFIVKSERPAYRYSQLVMTVYYYFLHQHGIQITYSAVVQFIKYLVKKEYMEYSYNEYRIVL